MTTHNNTEFEATFDRTVSLSAGESVISLMFRAPQELKTVILSRVKESDFDDSALRTIYAAIKTEHTAGRPTSAVDISMVLQSAGGFTLPVRERVERLALVSPEPLRWREYCRAVIAGAFLREVVASCAGVAAEAEQWSSEELIHHIGECVVRWRDLATRLGDRAIVAAINEAAA